MAELCINFTKVNLKVEDFRNCARLIRKQITQLESIKNNINLGSSTGSVQQSIESIKNDVDKKYVSMKSLTEQLEKIIREYQKTEDGLTGVVPQTKKISDSAESTDKVEDESKEDEDSYIENALQQALLGEFYHGETNALGDILSVIVSLFPGLNCLADIRDLAADIMHALNDGQINGKEAGLIALDVISVVGDVISLGTLIQGIKGATKATKVAKTAQKTAAKAAKKEAAEAAKHASKAAQEAAEKGTKKAARKATKTATDAAKKAEKAEAAKKVAKAASKEHKKNVAKESAKQIKDTIKDNVKDEITKSPDEIIRDEIKDDFMENTREEMKKNS